MSTVILPTNSSGTFGDTSPQFSSRTLVRNENPPEYTETMPYAITALTIAVLGIGVALATAKLVVIVAGSVIAIIGASVFDQIMAYDHAHPKGSKAQPTIHKFMLYGVGGGIVKTILLITAITIKLLVVL